MIEWNEEGIPFAIAGIVILFLIYWYDPIRRELRRYKRLVRKASKGKL